MNSKEKAFVDNLVVLRRSGRCTFQDIYDKYEDEISKVIGIFKSYLDSGIYISERDEVLFILDNLERRDLESNGLDSYISLTRDFKPYHEYLAKLDNIPNSILSRMDFDKEFELCSNEFYSKIIEQVDNCGDREIIERLCGCKYYSVEFLEFVFNHNKVYNPQIMCELVCPMASGLLLPLLQNKLLDNLDLSYADMFVCHFPNIDFPKIIEGLNRLSRVNVDLANLLVLKLTKSFYGSDFKELNTVLAKTLLSDESACLKFSKIIFLRDDYNELYEICKDKIFDSDHVRLSFKSREVFEEYMDVIIDEIESGKEVVVEVDRIVYSDFYIEYLSNNYSKGFDVDWMIRLLSEKSINKLIDRIPVGVIPCIDASRSVPTDMPEIDF